MGISTASTPFARKPGSSLSSPAKLRTSRAAPISTTKAMATSAAISTEPSGDRGLLMDLPAAGLLSARKACAAAGNANNMPHRTDNASTNSGV